MPSRKGRVGRAASPGRVPPRAGSSAQPARTARRVPAALLEARVAALEARVAKLEGRRAGPGDGRAAVVPIPPGVKRCPGCGLPLVRRKGRCTECGFPVN